MRLSLRARALAEQGSGSVNTAAITRRHRPDYQLVLFMGLLLLIGLVVLFAISPYQVERINLDGGSLDQAHFMQRQIMYLVAGLGAFIVAAFVPVSFWVKNASKILLLGLAACLLLSFLGLFIKSGIVYESGGAVRWFNLGIASFQPAELLKFGVMLFGAVFLGRKIQQNKLNNVPESIVPYAMILGLASLLIIVFQKDMGTGITMLGTAATMLFLGGLNKRLIFTTIILGIGASLLLIVTSPHRIARVATFLNPSDTSDAANYHINQAAIAIGSGGFAGKGLGQGVQAFGYLPEALNDSIFAVLGETFGMVGLLVIISIFVAMILRLLRIFERMPDPTLRMIVAGVTGLIMTHVLVNIGAMTGIFPLTGVTLPFLSFGGTSLLFTMLSLGIAFHISRYTVYKKEGARDDESSLRGRGVRRSRHAGSRRYQRA
ncbi:cell division protein FtsW [Candidatus Saccharibacteria bacterium]|nr:MAG: cell division protein FtsW [Candidatus Saccharibacteria bacterium]